MKSDKINIKIKTIYIAVMLLGALCFITVYGIRVLNPCYVDWLLNRGDLTQHYLGWCFFRESDWTFPIGLTNRLAYPDYSSVIYTDSIPLFAVFFKLLGTGLFYAAGAFCGENFECVSCGKRTDLNRLPSLYSLTNCNRENVSSHGAWRSLDHSFCDLSLCAS